MKQFLRDNDSLGASPQMTYKKGSLFGTSLGGCCSILLNLTLGSYIIAMLFGFFKTPNYNLSATEHYLNRMQTVPYELTSNDLIPTALLISNNANIFEIRFR